MSTLHPDALEAIPIRLPYDSVQYHILMTSTKKKFQLINKQQQQQQQQQYCVWILLLTPQSVRIFLINFSMPSSVTLLITFPLGLRSLKSGFGFNWFLNEYAERESPSSCDAYKFSFCEEIKIEFYLHIFVGLFTWIGVKCSILYPEFLATTNLFSHVDNGPRHFANTVWHRIESNGISLLPFCAPTIIFGSTWMYSEPCRFWWRSFLSRKNIKGT